MQERINIRPTLLLAILSSIAFATVWFVHKSQVEANVPGLIVLADQAQGQKLWDRQKRLLEAYLVHRPTDSEILSRYATLLESFARDPKDFTAVIEVYTRLVELIPDNLANQTRLIQMLIGQGYHQEALTRLEKLHPDQSDDPLIAFLTARCLDLLGLADQPSVDEFGWVVSRTEALLERAIQLDPDNLNYRSALATYLRQNQFVEIRKFADEYMDNLIRDYPDKADAYVVRAMYRDRYYSSNNKNKIIESDLATALKLSPDNIHILYLLGTRTLEAKSAVIYLETAHKLDSTNRSILVALCEKYSTIGEAKKAINILSEELKKSPGDAQLLMTLCQIQIRDDNLDGATSTLQTMTRFKLLPDLVAALEIDLAFKQRKWSAVIDLAQKNRELFTKAPPSVIADVFSNVGDAFLELNKPGLARESFLQARVAESHSSRALHGLAISLYRLNRFDEAVEQYHTLAYSPNADDNIKIQYAKLCIAQYQLISPSTRNNTDAPTLFKKLENLLQSNEMVPVLQSDILAIDKRFDKAIELLKFARKANPKSRTIALALVKLYRVALYAKAMSNTDAVRDSMAILNELQTTDGLSAELDGYKLEFVQRDFPQQSSSILNDVQDHADKYSLRSDRCLIATKLALAYSRLGQFMDAKRWIDGLSQSDPRNLEILALRFQNFVDLTDESGLDHLLKDIARIFGADSEQLHYYSAMKYLLVEKSVHSDALKKCLDHLDRAIKYSPDNATYLTRRAYTLNRLGKIEEALNDYRAAYALGERNPRSLQELFRLLYQTQQFREAEVLLPQIDSLQQNELSADVSRYVAQLLMGRNPDKALKYVELAVPASSDIYEAYIWKAELLLLAKRTDEARLSFIKATEFGKGKVLPCVKMFNFYLRTADIEAAKSYLAKFKELLPELEFHIATAQCQQLLGNLTEAEIHYGEAIKLSHSSIQVVKEVADFAYENKRPDFAIAYLRKVLMTDKNIDTLDRTILTKQLALCLSLKPEQAAVDEAIVLIDRILQSDPDSITNRYFKVVVLSTRPFYRDESIEILRKLVSEHTNNYQSVIQFKLGKYLAESGKWSEASPILLDVVKKNDQNEEYLRTFLEEKIKNHDYIDMDVWISKYSRLIPNPTSLLKLQLLAAHDRKNTREIQNLIHATCQIAKSDSENDTARFLRSGRVISDMASFLKLSDNSLTELETTYRKIAQTGNPEGQLAYANFLVIRGKTQNALVEANKCLDKLDKRNYVSSFVNSMYRSESLSGSDLSDLATHLITIIDKINSDITLREQFRALIYTRCGQYDLALNTFRKLGLDQKEVGTINNIAYLQILANPSNSDALLDIERSIKIYGPSAEALDTRGYHHLKNNRIKDAIPDLELCVKLQPRATRCLHLAMAYAQEGRSSDTAKMLARCKDLAYDGTLSVPAEREAFIDLLRNQ